VHLFLLRLGRVNGRKYPDKVDDRGTLSLGSEQRDSRIARRSLDAWHSSLTTLAMSPARRNEFEPCSCPSTSVWINFETVGDWVAAQIIDSARMHRHKSPSL
jgi:hypothetical protein